MQTRQSIQVKHALLEKVATFAEKCPVTFGISVVPMRPAPCITMPRWQITDLCAWREKQQTLISNLMLTNDAFTTALAILRQCCEQVDRMYRAGGGGRCGCGRGAMETCDCGCDPLACIDEVLCAMQTANNLATSAWNDWLALKDLAKKNNGEGADKRPPTDQESRDVAGVAAIVNGQLGSMNRRLDGVEMVSGAFNAKALAMDAARIAGTQAERADSTKDLAEAQAAASEIQTQVARATIAARSARDCAEQAAALGAAGAGMAQVAASLADEAASWAVAAAERANLAVDKLTPPPKPSKP